MRTFPIRAPLSFSRPRSTFFSRFAHAAAREDHSEHHDPSSTPSEAEFSRHPSHHRHTRKGKARADTQDQYTFPTRGKHGGPPSPYEILGLDRAAGDKEIKQSYYRLALLLHPDSSHPSSSADHFSTLHRAYTLLSDPHKRSSFLQTGYGWSSPGSSTSSYDDQMRAEIRYRRDHGARAWGHGRGFRESEAGRGAWGGFASGDGGWHPYHHDHDNNFFNGEKPKKEERYMSNELFVGVVSGLAIFAAYIQWLRLGGAAETTRGVLEQRHVVASHALAEARQEAALHGKERREKIRRRVRENEVLKEIEKMERGESSEASRSLGRDSNS